MSSVSVLVPNYNHDKYLKDRITTIIYQSHKPNEIIFMDDDSTDKSVSTIIKSPAFEIFKSKIIINIGNSNNPFSQWIKGIKFCSSKYIWIAESDDLSDLNFLKKSIEALEIDPSVNFCFSNSAKIDKYNVVDKAFYDHFLGIYDPNLLQKSRKYQASYFLRNSLSIRNVIPNVSSILWRASNLLKSIESIENQIVEYKIAGDWLLYISSCKLGGKVYHICDKLNYHRRHENSVSSKLSQLDEMREIKKIHILVKNIFPNDEELAARIEADECMLSARWKVKT